MLMLSWLARIDWVSLAWTVVIAICAILVYGRWIYAALRPVEPARAALLDGGLRSRSDRWPVPARRDENPQSTNPTGDTSRKP